MATTTRRVARRFPSFGPTFGMVPRNVVNKLFAVQAYIGGTAEARQAASGTLKNMTGTAAMMRATLTFFSSLALAVFTAAAIVAIAPWLSGKPSATGLSGQGGQGLQFESLILGVVIGLFVGTMGRYNWGDVPRRTVTWVLIRERQFFYYALIAGCIGVLLFY